MKDRHWDNRLNRNLDEGWLPPANTTVQALVNQLKGKVYRGPRDTDWVVQKRGEWTITSKTPWDTIKDALAVEGVDDPGSRELKEDVITARWHLGPPPLEIRQQLAWVLASAKIRKRWLAEKCT